MTTPSKRSERVDVAAVGPIDESTIFMLAAVISPQQARSNGAPLDGAALAPLVYVALKSEPNTVANVYFMEAAMGSLLASQTMPEWSGSFQARMVYFRMNRIQSTSPTSPLRYSDYAQDFSLFAYTDPAGLNQLTAPAPSNQPYILTWNSSKDLALIPRGSPTTSPPFLRINTTGPNNTPDFPALQAGIRYKLDLNLSSDYTVKYTISTDVVKEPSSAFQGLPNKVLDSNDNVGVINFPARNLDYVLLPVQWVSINATGASQLYQVTSGNFDAAKFHICDRWGALSTQGKNSPFYTRSCTTIDTVRGNTNYAIGSTVLGKAYFPSAIPLGCGDSWPTTTSYLDLTDTLVQATTSYGQCNSGVCYYNGTAQNFACYQYIPPDGGGGGSGGVCNPPCTDATRSACLATFCSSTTCNPCANITACNATTCAGNPDYEASTNVDNCTRKHEVSPLGWILIGVLIFIIVILLIVYIKRHSKRVDKGETGNLSDRAYDSDIYTEPSGGKSTTK